MNTTSKPVFSFQYQGHELQVMEDETVIWKGERTRLISVPTAMRNDIEIAFSRRAIQAVKTKMVTVPQLKAGMIVRQHGGRFLVEEDARYCQCAAGPDACAKANAKCIDGFVTGYFWPGSSWPMQGNHLAVVRVEVE